MIYLKGTVQYLAAWGTVTQCREDVLKRWRCSKELEEKYGRHEALGQDLAAVYAGLGDKDQAFAWLEKDFQAHSGLLMRVGWYAPYESLRGDPRLADLQRRMRLVP
ncbi:MAG TPA: hypothetical protein VKD91_17905 [Pyrinomonadaceae bacterium]|nr:hypothetical protein [Pyrinomonadaceae bacterium]